MRVDYAMIPELHLAARRHRAEAIAALVATAFAWLARLGRRAYAARHGQTLARGW
jgi:hypothetical protein